MRASRRRAMILFLALLSVYVVARVFHLWLLPEPKWGAEEIVHGVLPFHLQHGLVMPLGAYQFDIYAGGSLVVGVLAAPFFAWLGPNYLALQLSAWLLSIVTAAFLLALAWRLFGRPAAVAMAVALVAAPAVHVKWSLAALGNHMAIGFFIVAGFWLLDRWFRSPLRKSPVSVRHVGFVFGIGAVLGFAVWFEYEFLAAFAAMGFLAIVTAPSRKTIIVEALALLAGLRVGLQPWYSFHGGRSFIKYMAGFFSGLGGGPSVEIGSYNDATLFLKAVTVHFLQLFGDRDLFLHQGVAIPVVFFNILTYAGFAAAWIIVAWSTRGAWRKLAARLRGVPVEWSWQLFGAVLAAFVPAYLIVYALHPSYLPIPPRRYLFSLYPIIFLLIAAGVHLLWQAKRRWAAGIVLGLFALGGLGGQLGVYQSSKHGFATDTPGYDYRYFHEVLGHHYQFDLDFDKYAETAQEAYGDRRPDFLEGFCIGVAHWSGEYEVEWYLAQGREREREAAEAFIVGVGAASVSVPATRLKDSGELWPRGPAWQQAAIGRGRELAARFVPVGHNLEPQNLQ
ncbi:MAG: hypothetical protein P9L99_07230 [Candidatus Lernaella stagnicola]|nr:hypothetical protein [Candidatus Lernaella stagnicola]